MMNNYTNIAPIENVVSVRSYITMGIVGLIWILLAVLSKRKLKYFMMYNIAQSMIISMILLIFKLILELIFIIFAKIPILDVIAGLINFVISVKIIVINPLHMSFSAIQLIVFIFLLYIIVGVILGRILYIPWLTNLMQNVMKSYKD